MKNEWKDNKKKHPTRKRSTLLQSCIGSIVRKKKGKKWIDEKFPNATPVDIYTISNAYAKRMTQNEIESEAKNAEIRLNQISAMEYIPDEMLEQEDITTLAIMRMEKGMSQSQLAKASGINAQMIHKYESKIRILNRASAETVQKLAKALGCTMEQLLE